MKIKFGSDNDLPLQNMLDLRNMIIVTRAVSWRQEILPVSFLRWMFV